MGVFSARVQAARKGFRDEINEFVVIFQLSQGITRVLVCLFGSGFLQVVCLSHAQVLVPCSQMSHQAGGRQGLRTWCFWCKMAWLLGLGAQGHGIRVVHHP